MNDAEFLAAFEACTLPGADFHHRDHVRLAWILLGELQPAQAIARLSGGLRRFAAENGAPERYHETITWAYALLINERIERAGRGATWDDFASQNQDLFEANLLHRYYDAETLASPLARRVPVLPGRPAPGRDETA